MALLLLVLVGRESEREEIGKESGGTRGRDTVRGPLEEEVPVPGGEGPYGSSAIGEY